MISCFDCGAEAEFDHHVVPRSSGGTKTVPLCAKCHGLVHSIDMVSVGRLTSEALQRKKARGEFTGTAPYGYQLASDGVHLEPVPVEQQALTLARELRADGLSLRKVAAELDARGVRSRTGRTFAAVQIARMLELNNFIQQTGSP